MESSLTRRVSVTARQASARMGRLSIRASTRRRVRIDEGDSEAKRTALLLLDIQNEFAKPGGKFHDDVKDVIVENGMLWKIPAFVQAAREAGALIIHSPVVMKTGVRIETDDFDNQKLARLCTMNGLFTEGTWNCQFIDELQPLEDEYILTGRNDFSAFEGTELKDLLKRNNVHTLYMAGFLSNICIQETAQAARDMLPGMKVVVIRECCAAQSKDIHRNVMDYTLPIIIGCDVKTYSEAMHSMKSIAPSSDVLTASTKASTRNSIRVPARNSILANEITENLLPPKAHYRPRILAMHGARSNDEITRLQLENLGITQDDYDIVFLRGGIEVEEGNEETAGLVHGPFYSWFVGDKDTDAFGRSIIEAVRDVLRVVVCHGPFDGCYAFSNGAAVAALAAGIANDPSLRDAVQTFEDESMEVGLNGGVLRRLTGRGSAAPDRRLTADTRRSTAFRRATAVRPSQAHVHRGKSVVGREKSIRRGTLFNQAGSLEAGDLVEPPFKFVILACSASSPMENIAQLREAAKVRQVHLPLGSIRVPSFHLIGIDDLMKDQSEEYIQLFSQRDVKYMAGGHVISREVRSDQGIIEPLRMFMKTLGNPPPKAREADFKLVTKVSELAVLPHSQVALVKLINSRLPWRFAESATILSLLQEQPRDKPFLHVSRVADESTHTTYGDVVDFIQGGKGDLRRIGVRPGEVVAYGAPPAGGAVPALAFLSIGAQTTAAPLAPGTTKYEALDALDQFNASHMILFEGVQCPGIKEAFEEYSESGKAKLHLAVIAGNNLPGIFSFDSDPIRTNEGEDGFEDPPLRNPESGICLLLRTSGTTARPKAVPLRQDALVVNGSIIAASMGLRETDVCYSIMPLFHIGGISASILCTVASGGAVCCDDELFDPDRMVKALALSRPQPTWYSAVPTIHNSTVSFIKDTAPLDSTYAALGIGADGVWKTGHSLRMIRSGAAALLGPDGKALAKTYGNVPIYPTYSMSEQMPISQPPAGRGNILEEKPGSVGVPVAASTAIVSRSTLRPLPFGEEGEIAISGSTVLKEYYQNPDANRKAYFELTLDTGSDIIGDSTRGGRYFLTGDVGVLDKEGFLSLKGRAKELIKKAGEQVSPFEIEEPLLNHPWIQTPVCFSVPSKLYGEEIGCALVLSADAPLKESVQDIAVAMRAWLKEANVPPYKWPSKWTIVTEEDLPRTKTKKVIRIGLSSKLGLDPNDEDSSVKEDKETSKTKMDWGCLGGLRFLLACYVMFMHIGSNESWGRFNNLRAFPWHVHVFFTLGGYSMASPMNPAIEKKLSYFKARMWSMYPMYLFSLLFGLINLLVVCRPSTFRPEFHWNAQPDDLFLEDGSPAPFFCEGTPATQTSYWASLFLTIIVYIFGLAVTPTWFLNWWLGYYLWFSSMYYQCLAFYPATYNALFNRTRKKVALLMKIIIGLMLCNIVILVGAWFALRDGPSYYDDYVEAKSHNILVLSFYLFGPFWALYFVIGAATAFLYDAYRPAERHNARIWGWVADGCSIVLIVFSFAYIFQGKSTYTTNPELEMYMRPEEANQWTDAAVTNRIWDAGHARMFCPLTTLWIFALSTGQGLTARIFRWDVLSITLSPHAYNCFLFHQVVSQWYYAATRNGSFWNWWNYRKNMYWFSPQPCPVAWYEYFLVVGLVVCFSHLMNFIQPMFSDLLWSLWVQMKGAGGSDGEEEEDEDIHVLLLGIIEGLTGIEPRLEFTLEECGLASIAVPALAASLNKAFAKRNLNFTVTTADLVSATTIADIGDAIEAAKELADHQGV